MIRRYACARENSANRAAGRGGFKCTRRGGRAAGSSKSDRSVNGPYLILGPFGEQS